MARLEFLARITEDTQVFVIGVADAAVDVSENHADDVGVREPPEPRFVRVQGDLGAPECGDVDRESDDADRPALFVVDGAGPVPDVAVMAVAVHDPVFRLMERVPPGQAREVALRHPIEVIGMDPARPPIRGRLGLFGAEARQGEESRGSLDSSESIFHS